MTGTSRKTDDLVPGDDLQFIDGDQDPGETVTSAPGSAMDVKQNTRNEICTECVFDSSRWTRQDAIRTIEHAADLVGYATEGFAHEHWNTRARSDMWSIAEYVDHVRMVIEIHRLGCATAQTQPNAELPTVEPEPVSRAPTIHEPEALVAALAQEARAAQRFFLGLDGDQWSQGLMVAGSLWTCDYSLTHIGHELLHHLGDIAAIRNLFEDPVGPLEGSVAQVNGSNGGVPKEAMPTATVGLGGLEGDRQATRRHHGRPWQAVCLYSADIIDALQQEGHPITAGDVGENLTLQAIDWSALRAGLVVVIGDVSLRLSSPAAPCSKTSYAFSDGNHMRMDHHRHPGWARWYASVLRGGTIRPGDRVEVS
jgi:MOSC domain-containing protein YiiM